MFLKTERSEMKVMQICVGCVGILWAILDETIRIAHLSSNTYSVLKFIADILLGIAIGIPIGLKIYQRCGKEK